MDLIQYVIEECPKRCGVHPSGGVTAGLVYREEINGNQSFVADKFETVRDRALIALPYYPMNKDAFFECLDVIELCALYDGQIRKGQKHQRRINHLEKQRVYDNIEKEVIETEIKRLESEKLKEKEPGAKSSSWNG